MNHRTFQPCNGEAFCDDVQRDSELRLAAPLPFALEALEDLFRHESGKERGFVRWQRKLEQSIWWADDAIQCLEKSPGRSTTESGRPPSRARDQHLGAGSRG